MSGYNLILLSVPTYSNGLMFVVIGLSKKKVNPKQENTLKGKKIGSTELPMELKQRYIKG